MEQQAYFPYLEAVIRKIKSINQPTPDWQSYNFRWRELPAIEVQVESVGALLILKLHKHAVPVLHRIITITMTAAHRCFICAHNQMQSTLYAFGNSPDDTDLRSVLNAGAAEADEVVRRDAGWDGEHQEARATPWLQEAWNEAAGKRAN
jgi:hypothetical protein